MSSCQLNISSPSYDVELYKINNKNQRNLRAGGED